MTYMNQQAGLDMLSQGTVLQYDVFFDASSLAPPSAMQFALQKLYVAYFTRPADVSGLSYWRDALDSGTVTLAQIGQFMADDFEYKASFRNPDGSAMNDFQSVNNVYLSLFGREAEPAGLQYWGNAMKAGQVTIADVVLAVGNGAQGSDLVALNCKVLGAHYFTSSLDTTTEILSYVGAQANAMGRLFIQSITSQETLCAMLGQDDLAVIGSGQHLVVADAPTVTEGDSGNKLVTFTLTLDRDPALPLKLLYETLHTGSAKPGDDFIPATGTVTFGAGQKVATVVISIIGNTLAEQSESFSIRFTSPRLLGEVTATATIIDNDAIPPGSSIPAYDAALLDSYAPYDAGDTAADQSLLILVGINTDCI